MYIHDKTLRVFHMTNEVAIECVYLHYTMHTVFIDAQTRRNILQGLQEARSRLQRLQEDPNAKYLHLYLCYCMLYSKEFLGQEILHTVNPEMFTSILPSHFLRMTVICESCMCEN